MERLFIYLHNEVLKARQVERHETLTNPMVWKDIEFELVDSSFMMITWPILLPELPPEAARSLLDLIGARYPFSPHHEKLLAVCPALAFSKPIDEWIFFGGSFNPWHKGHQACLNLLPEDKTCFILPDRSPHKELKALEPVSTTIELVTKIKFGKNHYMSPTFLLDFQKNPTVDWMEKFKKSSNHKLSLLMGFDSFKNILTWTRATDLLKTLETLYVVSRLETDQEHEETSAPIKQLVPNLKIEFLGRHEFEDLSSTAFRKSAGNN